MIEPDTSPRFQARTLQQLMERDMTENACRHFKGIIPRSTPSCARGWDVVKWATKCNGGSDLGILKRLPCTKQTGQIPLFDCPSVDRKTDEEVEEDKAAFRKEMAQLTEILPQIGAMKKKMIKNNLSYAVATCPWCGVKDALRVSVAIGGNEHLHCVCRSCSKGIME